MKPLLTLLLLLSILCPNFAQSIDSEASKITFEISNMGLNTVEGTFGGMNGTVQFDSQNLANSRFDVCISAESVNTGIDKRDKHLREEDYFAVAQYPNICFRSSTISQTAEGFVAEGTLTMRGVSKEVRIPFTFANKTFNGTLTVKRKDYNIGPGGGFMVGKTVEMEIICVLK
ncbi:MAG: YceI family protein [Bacteroidota bacterium]